MYAITGYKIGEKLYESSNSLIFRTLREAVILRTIKGEYPSQEHIAQFKQEYEIARNLKTGPIAREAATGVAATYNIAQLHYRSGIFLPQVNGPVDKYLGNNFTNQWYD